MTYTQEKLDALVAAIDSGDIGALDTLPTDAGLPDGAAGQIMLAARACRRLREAAAHVIASACEGEFGEALATAIEAEANLSVIRKHLYAAASLNGSAP